MSEVLELFEDSIEYDPQTEELYFEAQVDDCIQVAPATLYDPPAFGCARCSCSLLWTQTQGEPFDPPTKDNILAHLQTSSPDWQIITDLL